MLRWLALIALLGLPTCGLRAQAAAAPPLHERAGSPAGEARTKLQADADHLLALAESLKAKVDATKKDELSIDVIREADQIEKLARSLMERPK